jgi:hypothetical protein
MTDDAEDPTTEKTEKAKSRRVGQVIERGGCPQ